METLGTPSSLSFSLKQSSPQFGYVTITIPRLFVEKLYAEASQEQKTGSHVYGFSRGNAPISYIEQNFQPHLLEHIKEFFFKYFVIQCLYKELQDKKIFFAEEPRLTDIVVTPHEDATYTFSLTLAQPILLQGWKRLPFKAPKRKNYKDLDRQVENFLKEEIEIFKKTSSSSIAIGDWINFTVSLLNKNLEPLLHPITEELWLKIGGEEIDNSFQSLFLGKKVGDAFVTNHSALQEYFSTHLDTHYQFLITIADHLSGSHFCIDYFKKHFRIKSSKELHQKCIEVFSYRNDISQRRATSEDALRLLLSKHNLTIPSHLVLRQEKALLEMIHDQPDYNVYKTQQDFKEKIRLLAEKQLKENLVIQQLAFFENLEVTKEDIKYYLNLLNRQRTSEFIYFQPPTTRFMGKETPISAAIMAQCCLREKTLNHAIYHFTKQKQKP